MKLHRFGPRWAASPAFVVALIALFVALGGTTYAATSLAKNSVGTKQIKNGAVTKAKINGKAISALKGQTGPKGQQGVAGVAGPPGPKGDKGDQGIQGLKGDQGIQGIQGIQGEAGPGYSNGTGLDLSNANAFSIDPTYQLPQSCSDGQIAKWDAANSDWTCADQASGPVSGSGTTPNGHTNSFVALADGVSFGGGCTGALPAGAELDFNTGGNGAVDVFGFLNQDGTLTSVNATGTGDVELGDIGVNVVDFTGMVGKEGTGTFEQVTAQGVSLGSPNGCTFSWVVTPTS